MNEYEINIKKIISKLEKKKIINTLIYMKKKKTFLKLL